VLINENGGLVVPNVEFFTLQIVPNYFNDFREFCTGIILHEEWLHASIKADKILPFADFRLQPDQLMGQQLSLLLSTKGEPFTLRDTYIIYKLMTDSKDKVQGSFTPEIKRWFNEGYTVGRGENTPLMLYNKIYYAFKNKPEIAYMKFLELAKENLTYCNNFAELPEDFVSLQSRLNLAGRCNNWEAQRAKVAELT